MFNVKIKFNQSRKVSEIIAGNYGDDKPAEVKQYDTPESFTDAILSGSGDIVLKWPVNPAFTGAYGILSILRLPVSDNLKIVGFDY